MCATLPNRHSFRREFAYESRRFPGAERRSTPVPISSSRSRFGTVSRNTHWQALTGLSWLSYSSSEICSDSRTGQVRTGTSPCSVLPTPARLNAPTHRQFSRTVISILSVKVTPASSSAEDYRACRPEPPGQDYATGSNSITVASPALIHDGLTRDCSVIRSVRIAPAPHQPSDRMPGLLCCGM